MSAAAPERVFLVDGTALVYRAHFAFFRNPLVTSRGESVSAVYGFAAALFQLLRVEQPHRMAVAFDLGAPTFRHLQYAGYKANRPPMPDELAAQFPRARQLVEALGLRVLEQEGIEADDLIGTLTALARRQGHEVVIVSADKDFMQLIGPGVRQWIPPNAGSEAQWVDAAGVRQRWGVRPEQMVDLLALVGDTSDNVPGVAGIGPKTAAQLLEEFATLDGVYAALDRVGKKGVREKLAAGREAAFLSRDLVRIRCDLAPPVGLDDLRVPPLTGRPELVSLLKELEFRRLLEGLGELEEETWTAQYDVADTAEALETALERWRATGFPLSVKAESTSRNGRPDALVGLSLAWEPGRAIYVPIGHCEGRCVAAAAVARLLSPILSDAKVTVIGQDLKTDFHALARGGLEDPPRATIRDILLAAYLIDSEGAAPSLEALSREHLHHRMTPIEELIGQGRKRITLDRVPVEKLAHYSGEDADVVLRLFRALTPRLESQGLAGLWRDLECPLAIVLLRMERAGVRVDASWLGALGRVMEKDLERLTSEIHRAAGREFNINSPAQLAVMLFETLKLPSRKRTKTGRSTDQDVLESLAELHPLPRLLLEHRVLSKLKGTYVDALPALIDPGTGRIHASFNQMVAATGRLSSSDPNLQNIPIRSPLGREIRKAFIAEPGARLLSADYSQIELRVLAHLSGDEGLREAFGRGHDVHAATAARIFGVAPEQVDAQMRARAKMVNFGVIYGMGPQRLARELSIPLAEAREFIDSYLSKMPGVRTWLERNLDSARRAGYVTTLFGRRRRLRGLESGDARVRSQAERIAANAPIQGSAADLIKRAMLTLDRSLAEHGLRSRLILQVHDELVLEVPEAELDTAAELVREAMSGAASLDVPLAVELGHGANWAEAHR